MNFKYINFLSFYIIYIFLSFNAHTGKFETFFQNQINKNVENQNFEQNHIDLFSLFLRKLKGSLIMNRLHVVKFIHQIKFQNNENELSNMTNNSSNEIFKHNLLMLSNEYSYSALYKQKNITSNKLIFFRAYICCKYNFINIIINYLKQNEKTKQLELTLFTILYLQKIMLDSKYVNVQKFLSRSFLVSYEIFLYLKKIHTKTILLEKDILKDFNINYIYQSKSPNIFFVCKTKMLHINIIAAIIIYEQNKIKFAKKNKYFDSRVLHSTKNISNIITINSNKNNKIISDNKEGYVQIFILACIPFFCNNTTGNIFGNIEKLIGKNIISFIILRKFLFFNFWLKTSHIQLLKFNVFTFFISIKICRMAINNTEYTSGDFDDMVKDNDSGKYYKSLDLLSPRHRKKQHLKKQIPTNKKRNEYNDNAPNKNTNVDVNTVSSNTNIDNNVCKKIVETVVFLASLSLMGFVLGVLTGICYLYFK